MLEVFLPDSVKTILLGLLATAFALAWLARALPHIAWLQAFRLPATHMNEEQRAQRRRSANRHAALEIVVAGLCLPLLYFVATVMMFNEFKTMATTIVTVCSIACIAVGTWIFVRNGEP
jgi:peptidoglycan/LPS O-acetylase OafA/YrhL